MTGNIIGENFSTKVTASIENRQKVHGSGFASKRTPDQIQYLNNRNAWLKLASSVYVIGEQTNTNFKYKQNDATGEEFIQTDANRDGIYDGVERLKAIGISDPENFVGNQLAQKTVLFNTLQEAQFDSKSEFTSYKSRSGVSKTNSLWNSDYSYGLGGSEFGLSPAPGLIDADIKCINRGSIREVTVTIKAYNRFQFELLELVYLRLGYSVMLEWGFDKYIDENQKIENVGNTLIENKWFKNQIPNLAIYSWIEKYRQDYNYHYDGFYGKVTNFDWQFNADGTYDITLKLITRGDVIESLTARNKVLSITPEDIQEDIDDQSGFLGFGKKGVGEIPESNIVGVAGDSKLGLKLYELVRDKKWAERIEGDTVRGPFFSWESAREHYDQDYPNIDLPDYNYFMTLGKLLEYCQNLLQPTVGKEFPEPAALVFNYSEDDNVGTTYPNLISLDPKVCLIKPQLFQTSDNTIEELNIPDYFNDLKEYNFNDGDCYFGKIMNIYLNFEFIAESLAGVNDEGELSIYGFLEQITTGINKSFGNIINLEPIIKDDIIVTIIDQNPIPGLVKPPTPTISLFGSEISGSNTTSNFVTDINFKTEVTPDLATQITVGATAGGSATKNYDATPFSNWNKGLIDRQNPSFQDTPGYEEEDDDLSAINAAWEAGNEVGNITKFINIRISGNLAQISDNEVNKNVKFEGITFPNVEYYTFVSLAKGYLYAKNVFKQVVEVLPTTIVGNFLDSLLYDEAKQYDNNFQLYLVRAFGGKINIKTDKGNTKSVPIKIKNALYTQLSDDFVSEGHQSFKGYVNLNNQKLFKETGQPSTQIGFLPLKLGFTTEGISGIKIYNSFKSKTRFLPSQYDKAVNFIIEQVDHKISDNNWTTNLGCLSIPKTDSEQYKSPFKGKTRTLTPESTLVVNSGPIDPPGVIDRDGLLTDDPLKIIDNRTVNGVPVNTGTYGQEISINTAVGYMNKNVQNQFRQFYNNLKNGGYDSYVISINAVYRSFQRSVELKEQNPKNASPGKSVHNYAAGVDFNVTDSLGRVLRKADYDPWIEQGIVAEAEKVGILWGGYFAGYRDSIHFYVQFNRDTALQNAAADNPGKPQRDWDTKNTDLK